MCWCWGNDARCKTLQNHHAPCEVYLDYMSRPLTPADQFKVARTVATWWKPWSKGVHLSSRCAVEESSGSILITRVLHIWNHRCNWYSHDLVYIQQTCTHYLYCTHTIKSIYWSIKHRYAWIPANHWFLWVFSAATFVHHRYHEVLCVFLVLVCLFFAEPAIEGVQTDSVWTTTTFLWHGPCFSARYHKIRSPNSEKARKYR